MSRRIIALNNNGVKSLYHGRFNDAILSFHHAMQCTKQEAAAFGHQESPSNYCVNLPQCSMDCLDQSTLMAVSPHNMFEVYRNAILLSKDTASVMDMEEISIVLFYNLALAHHLAGLAVQDDSKTQLNEAMHLYKLVLNVAKSRHESSVDLLTMILGSLTNLGHVCSHFWKVPEAESCYTMLNEILDTPAVFSLTDEDGDFFFSTLSFCSSQQHCALAPAA